MKKIIAMAICLAMLLACAAAAAEAETKSMGVLKVNGAFDITYSPLPDDYILSIYQQNDMTIIANIQSEQKTLPMMGLVIAYNDMWAGVERLNDVSEEDMQVIRGYFSEEYQDPVFDIRETSFGTKLLTVMSPSSLDAYVYTIYRSHEIEIHLIPGEEQEALTDADIERVVAFLSDMQFVPVEAQPAGEAAE